MSQTWQNIHTRGQQTVAVWTNFNAAFKVGTLTLAAHQTNVDALPGAAQDQKDQQDVLDAARADRDATIADIRDLATRMPRKLDGELAADDPLHGDLEDIRAIEMTGQDSVLTRGQMVLSLWNKYDARQLAQTPPLPLLLVSSRTNGDLGAILAMLPEKTQTVENEKSNFSTRRSALRTLSNTVDRDNKRWFAAWQGEYATGTPENDALSQIDTGSSTPAPAPLEIATAAATGPAVARLTYAAEGGDHATDLLVQWRFSDDGEFANDTAITRPQQDISQPGFAGRSVLFRTLARNSTDTVFSAEKTVTF